MSKLDELIKELCPDGVECVALENVCMISKGVQFNKKDMHDEGTYPVINGGINPSGYIEQFNQALFVKLVVSKSDVYSYYIPISKGLVA